MKESDIVHENGHFWVFADRKNKCYTVYRANVATHGSYADSSYAFDADGLSIAIARCNYLAR